MRLPKFLLSVGLQPDQFGTEQEASPWASGQDPAQEGELGQEGLVLPLMLLLLLPPGAPHHCDCQGEVPPVCCCRGGSQLSTATAVEPHFGGCGGVALMVVVVVVAALSLSTPLHHPMLGPALWAMEVALAQCWSSQAAASCCRLNLCQPARGDL